MNLSFYNLFLQSNYRIRSLNLSHNEFSDTAGEYLGQMLGMSPWREVDWSGRPGGAGMGHWEGDHLELDFPFN